MEKNVEFEIKPESDLIILCGSTGKFKYRLYAVNYKENTWYEIKSVDIDAIIKTVQIFGYADLATSIQACIKARGVKLYVVF